MEESPRAAVRRAVLIFVFAALAPTPGATQVFPAYLNYQGKLGDPSGNPKTGTYSFRFKLYSQASGGSPVFTDANFTGANAPTVANGVYSVQIGSLTAGGIPPSVFQTPEVWLEVDVSAGTTFAAVETLTPRERLAASPFAFLASNAQYLGTGVAVATFTSAGNLQLVSGSTITSNGTLTFSTAASAALTGTPALFINQAGNVGIGTANPVAKLDVNGTIRLGTSSTCDASTEGSQRYNSTSKIMEFCNGTVWAGVGVARLPTRQVFLSGSGATYTTPAGVSQLRLRMKGGGGGGAGTADASCGNTVGSTGGSTIFNSINAAGGGGGQQIIGGGSGGTGGSGAASVRIAGAAGSGGSNSINGNANQHILGGTGGGQGGGRIANATAGADGVANSGGGGGGGTGTASVAYQNACYGGGGGEGEYVELIINAPAATYTYTVGAGGAAGSAGTNGAAGGNGGSGVIIVDEY
jgi:hypothetical protein